MSSHRGASRASFYHLGTPEQGALNIVDRVLSLKKGDRMVIILDQNTAEFMAPVEELAAERLGRAGVRTWRLEEFGERNLCTQQGLEPEIVSQSTDFQNLLQELDRASVGLFAAASLGREVALRDRLRIHGCSNAGRFLHLPNMTRDILCMGFCADQDLVHALTTAMAELLRKARWARVTSRNGSDAWIALGYRWVLADSLLSPGNWANVGAEVFTCPVAVEGRWVADGGMGDVFSRYGLLAEQPLNFEIKGGIVTGCESTNSTLQEHYKTYASADPCGNGRRIGEFALPTNPELTAAGLIGVNMQDEKALVHLASGYPRADETMGNLVPEQFWWDSATHVDFSACNTTVTLYHDTGEPVEVMRDDFPADAVWNAMKLNGSRLKERIDHIRNHVRLNEGLPLAKRQQRIHFD